MDILLYIHNQMDLGLMTVFGCVRFGQVYRFSTWKIQRVGSSSRHADWGDFARWTLVHFWVRVYEIRIPLTLD